MALNKKAFSAYVKEFKFPELFNEMGWNKDKTNQPIVIDSETFILKGIAEKHGFKILLCSPDQEGLIPEYAIRKKIEAKVTKLFQEHLIIFVDSKSTEQIWQLVVREMGKPAKISETRYLVSQEPELLFQRAAGIFFELDEEENITIVDVTQRVTENFQQNNERVTKQFYEKFSKEHTAFLKFIKGIEEKVNKEWYASLMLNRLMFCYFIQKKGFLDKNKNYLRDKLDLCQEKKGKGKFYSFYKNFLRVLFHKGLGAADHSDDVKKEIGRIPYLNGGLFEEHEIEKTNPDIDIDDKAFERIFDFFDDWEWHLDTRHTASGKDINPDVIGYIFEKYINDRAQMGAYYTKEDITNYISKNCILPYLFDETKRQYPKAFADDGEIWTMIRESGDAYIYPAVKKGVELPLPRGIEAGVKDVSKRTDWSKSAPSEFALPTEIWREVVERRNRYQEIKTKIANGEVKCINDFITYNLDISQFVQDLAQSTNDTDFLRLFYKALNNVTIIDPTCGSGAFLFAAMNILEPLYEACIMRMRAFVEDEDRVNKEKKSTCNNKYKYFREVLENIQSPQHPNLQYFIYKSIILCNLYGVDIMKEAVEIAKLRLFLKLVTTVDADYSKPNLGLEPLPDIDFNIRSGNTLIGFGNQTELRKGLEYTIEGVLAQPAIDEKCEIVSRSYRRYKEIQLTHGDDYSQFKIAKDDLLIRLKELNHELNQLFHKQNPSIKYSKWLDTHQPFHWFAEFYEILHDKNGFDVIIGNPPYVEYSDVKKSYILKDYVTMSTGNLFSYVIERSISIAHPKSQIGMIVPISSVSTPRMNPLMRLISNQSSQLHVSNFAVRPGKLFTGADMNLSILIFEKALKPGSKVFTTGYNRWNSEARDFVFRNLEYVGSSYDSKLNTLPKIKDKISLSIWTKLEKFKNLTTYPFAEYKDEIYYHSGGRYFRKCLDRPLSNEYKQLKVPNATQYHFISLFSSSLYYLYWIEVSDTYHVTKSDISFFPFPDSIMTDNELKRLGKKLLKDLEKNAIKVDRKRKDGSTVEETNFFVGKSKSILDEIDKILATHYTFDEKEVDYIINYDIKYRIDRTNVE